MERKELIKYIYKLLKEGEINVWQYYDLIQLRKARLRIIIDGQTTFRYVLFEAQPDEMQVLDGVVLAKDYSNNNKVGKRAYSYMKSELVDLTKEDINEYRKRYAPNPGLIRIDDVVKLFSFKERLAILFGKPVRSITVIETAETPKITRQESVLFVEP